MLRASLVLIAVCLLLTDVVCKKHRITEDKPLWNYREMVNKGAIADFEWREPVTLEQPAENNGADSSQISEETRIESDVIDTADVTEPPRHKLNEKNDDEEDVTDRVKSASTQRTDQREGQRDEPAGYEARLLNEAKPFYPESITYDESPVDDLSDIYIFPVDRGFPESRGRTTSENCDCSPKDYRDRRCRPQMKGCSNEKCDCNGPQGVRGPPGRTGEDGDRGKTGNIGPSGRSGRPGARGYRGMAGQPGDPGPNGPPGPVGIQGYEGHTGSVGRPGNPGLPGKPGIPGAAGPDGYDGLKGPDGDPGIIGDRGNPGRDGPPGLRGREGPKGDPGDPGRPGVFGCRGIEGDIGKPGPDGDSGESIKGEKGARCEVSCPVPYDFRGFLSRGKKGDQGDASRLTGDLKEDERTVRNYLKQLLPIKGQKGEQGENYGYPGRPGDTGYPGALGPPGYPGPPGLPGRVAYSYGPRSTMLSDEPAGLPGLPGHPGEKGDPGEVRTTYEPGTAPEEGDPGEPGSRGRKGKRGKLGRAGRKGVPGVKGPPGCDDVGPAGPPGDPGSSGVGIPGGLGPQGTRGDDGSTGPPGPRGSDGPPGIRGPKGRAGMRGPKGETGDCGCQGPPGPGLEGSASYVYARHSQSKVSPGCGSHTLLWDGYSLLHFEANTRTHVQDLGAAGSCLKQFEPMPLMFCHSNRGCARIRRKSSSYWLSSGHLPTTLPTTNLTEIREMIGRCSVCETKGPALTKHSQSNRVRPTCPLGWDFLWDGYSFVMHSVTQRGGGQQMYSPGSCLEKFRGKLYVECNGNGRCHVYGENLGFWLDGSCDCTSVSGESSCRGYITERANMTMLETEKVISRCTVCLKI